MKLDPLGTLALQFALLSLVAIGGANAVVPEMHRMAVESYGWMPDQEFADLFAISSTAPGPNVLIVALIGFKVAGVLGALIATIAMCGPSSLLSYTVSRLWQRTSGAAWQSFIRHSLAPVTIGLVIASGWVLAQAADIDWAGIAITLAMIAALTTSKLNPIWLFGVAGLLGVAGIG